MGVDKMTFEQVYQRLYNRYGKKRLHQWINHPGFNDWEVVRGKNRGPIIDGDIRLMMRGQYQRNRFILDIGAFHGGITIYLALMNNVVVGVEKKISRLQIADYFLSHFAENDPDLLHRCCFVGNDVVEFFDMIVEGIDFDIILLLSVDYWIKKEHGVKSLVWLFRKIYDNCKYLYFETCNSQLEESLRLLEHVGFKNQEVIGRDDGETKREIYRCW